MAQKVVFVYDDALTRHVLSDTHPMKPVRLRYTYELLEKSRFVASITGTACWESVSGGKPALIFGNTWFKSLPGIVSWRPGLTVEDITGAEIDHAELEAAYSRTMSKTVSGIVDVAFKSIHPDYSEEKNGEHLTSFLRKVLNLSGASE